MRAALATVYVDFRLAGQLVDFLVDYSCFSLSAVSFCNVKPTAFFIGWGVCAAFFGKMGKI